MTVSTIGPGTPHIPQWDMNDRLNKSLKESGLSVQQIADYFDVHRNTVSGWLHGRINPDTRTLRLWAVITGVPYEWIKDGTEPHTPPPGGGLPFEPPAANTANRKRRPNSRNKPTGWWRAA